MSRFKLVAAALSLTPEFPKETISKPSHRPQQLQLKTMYYADLITLGQEVDFPTELSRSSEALIWQNLVHIASRELIIAMKRQAGREVDLNDVARLESCG